MTLKREAEIFLSALQSETRGFFFFKSIFEGTSKIHQCLDVQKSLTYGGKKVKKKLRKKKGVRYDFHLDFISFTEVKLYLKEDEGE